MMVYRIFEILQRHKVALIHDWDHDKERRSGAGVDNGLVVSNGDHTASVHATPLRHAVLGCTVSRRLGAKRIAKGPEYLFEPS
jgi:hypothetical protein